MIAPTSRRLDDLCTSLRAQKRPNGCEFGLAHPVVINLRLAGAVPHRPSRGRGAQKGYNRFRIVAPRRAGLHQLLQVRFRPGVEVRGHGSPPVPQQGFREPVLLADQAPEERITGDLGVQPARAVHEGVDWIFSVLAAT